MMKQPPRRPQAFEPDDRVEKPSRDELHAPVSEPSDDVIGVKRPNDDALGSTASDADEAFEAEQDERSSRTTAPVAPAAPFGWASAFISAVLLLSSLALGVWFSRFVSVVVARDDWIGWTAKGLALFIAAIIAVAVLREILGFYRLARLSRLRQQCTEALATGDFNVEQRAIKHLKGLASGRAEYRWALAKFREQERHKTTPGSLLTLADTVLLADADKEARRVIFESARRVAVVTAVVPIAFIAVLFVLFENVRMLRRLASAYGGRPGFIGGWRLFMRVIFHIAATGAIALTDDLFGQFLGQDMVRRLSARLGEGAFNGALTARLGIVAIELTRPCPYIEAKPLRARHVVSEVFPEFNAGELMGRMVGRRKKGESD